MSVYHHPYWTAFVAGIIDDPARDLRRLVAADWLEEQAANVECPHCAYDGCTAWGQKCDQCRGEKWVSDGLAERAEFIRLQCEIDAHRYGKAARTGDYDSRDAVGEEWGDLFALVAREAVLFYRYCDNWWPNLHAAIGHPRTRVVGRLMCVVVERGWPAVLLGRSDGVWGGECDHAVIASHPITQVVVTDAEPRFQQTRGGRSDFRRWAYTWSFGDATRRADIIPRHLKQWFPKFVPEGIGRWTADGVFIEFWERENAIDALSAAVIKAARPTPARQETR